MLNCSGPRVPFGAYVSVCLGQAQIGSYGAHYLATVGVWSACIRGLDLAVLRGRMS